MAKDVRSVTIRGVKSNEEANGRKESAVQSDQRKHEVIEDRKALSTQDERTWSVLSHLSMFLNLVTGFPLDYRSSGGPPSRR